MGQSCKCHTQALNELDFHAHPSVQKRAFSRMGVHEKANAGALAVWHLPVIPTDQISNSDMEELKLLAALKKMVSPKQDKK